MSWSDAAVNRLKAMHAKGASFGEMAKDSVIRAGGHSRNACIGKAMRIGLHPRGGGAGEAAGIAAKINSPNRAPPVSRNARHVGVVEAGSKPSAPLPKMRVVHTDAVHRTTADPEFGGCRWPVDGEGADTLFCCAAQEPKRPYCAAHVAIAFQPLPSGKPRTGNELARSLRRYG